VPANDLEQLVAGRISTFLTAEQDLLDAFAAECYSAAEQQAMLQAARDKVYTWADSALAEQRAFFQATIERVMVKDGCIEISINRVGLKQLLLAKSETSAAIGADLACSTVISQPIILTAAARLMRCGLEVRLVIAGEAKQQETARTSQSLIKAIARGRYWYEQLTSRGSMSLSELAEASGVNDRYASRILRFAFLAPDIVEAILEGRQPKGMTLDKAFINMPQRWEEQRQLYDL
jgi:site-specific DNA recombinase